MDYEELYAGLQAMEKELKEKIAAAGKYHKNAVKSTENGDIKSLYKDLNSLSEALSAGQAALDNLKQELGGFDAKAYFESGDFARQLLEDCKEKGIDVQGEYPVYEMFPYRVRIDGENQDVYLDRKRIPCVRPSEMAGRIKAGQDKLMKAAFNVQGFLNELAAAYDLAMVKEKKVVNGDIYLTTLYKYMTPMARARKEYDLQNFAFDLARLYAEKALTTKDGRRYQFGPSRNNNKSVRILNSTGKEEFLSTIRFFEG